MYCCMYEPGFRSVAPGIGASRGPPVSVCLIVIRIITKITIIIIIIITVSSIMIMIITIIIVIMRSSSSSSSSSSRPSLSAR